MDPDNLRFGRGPRELTGAVDLVSHYKLLPHHAFFCKRPLPLSISDTHYLHNVVGDTEIRKGEGMQLDQLIGDPSFGRETSARIQPFDMDVLLEAFQLRETSPVHLPTSEKGIPTVAGKSRRSMMEMKMSMTFTSTRKVSTKAQRLMRWVLLKRRVTYSFLLIENVSGLRKDLQEGEFT
ncbi:hypothetical protein Leryth_002783 [Lithospermum erythrorhizon]|nr:hypothetical protein Leryth_002783 [Lithospermum erythrorhizon]